MNSYGYRVLRIHVPLQSMLITCYVINIITENMFVSAVVGVAAHEIVRVIWKRLEAISKDHQRSWHHVLTIAMIISAGVIILAAGTIKIFIVYGPLLAICFGGILICIILFIVLWYESRQPVNLED